MSFHCILLQESLCKAPLDLKHMMDLFVNVVNTIRAGGGDQSNGHTSIDNLSLLEDLKAEYGDVIYHNKCGG